MKHNTYIVFIFASSFVCLLPSLWAEPRLKVAENININVNPVISPQMNNRPTQNAITRIEQKQITFTKINIRMPSVPVGYYKQQAHMHYSNILKWLHEHRYSLIISCAIGTYGYLCYLVHKATTYIQDNSHWFGWRRDCSLEQLLNSPENEMTHQLLVAIETRYVTPENPTNFLEPLMHFMRDINNEINLLHRYKKLFLWLDRFHLAYITFANTQHTLLIQEKIDRLAYFKQLFGRWVAEQNLQAYLNQEKEPFIKRLYKTIKKPLVFIAQLPVRMARKLEKI